MRDQLPDSVNPWQLAMAGAELTGQIPLTGLDRLAGATNACVGAATVSLRFEVNGDGWRIVSGHIEAQLELICQRCLQPFLQRVEAFPQLALLQTEAQMKALPGAYDPLLADDVLELAPLVEDELILALPLVPKHSSNRCAPTAPVSGDSADENGRKHPFADLVRLLDRQV